MKYLCEHRRLFSRCKSHSPVGKEQEIPIGFDHQGLVEHVRLHDVDAKSHVIARDRFRGQRKSEQTADPLHLLAISRESPDLDTTFCSLEVGIEVVHLTAA